MEKEPVFQWVLGTVVFKIALKCDCFSEGGSGAFSRAGSGGLESWLCWSGQLALGRMWRSLQLGEERYPGVLGQCSLPVVFCLLPGDNSFINGIAPGRWVFLR